MFHWPIPMLTLTYDASLIRILHGNGYSSVEMDHQQGHVLAPYKGQRSEANRSICHPLLMSSLFKGLFIV